MVSFEKHPLHFFSRGIKASKTICSMNLDELLGGSNVASCRRLNPLEE